MLDFTDTSDSCTEKWHFVSSPACLPFNTRGLFLVNLHNSRTWASMGPRFHLEPTVQCYSWTLKEKVKPRKRALRSTEFKEGNVYEISMLAVGCSQVHIEPQNLTTVCAMLWVAAAQQNIIITITSGLMYNSISCSFKAYKGCFFRSFPSFWERHGLDLIWVWEFLVYLRAILQSGPPCVMSHLMQPDKQFSRTYNITETKSAVWARGHQSAHFLMLAGSFSPALKYHGREVLYELVTNIGFSPSPISWVTCGFSDSHPLASLPHLQSYDLDRSLPTLIQLCLQPDFGWQETIKAPAITIPIHPHAPYFILICLSAFSTQG